jgi:hypothetical protein
MPVKRYVPVKTILIKTTALHGASTLALQLPKVGQHFVFAAPKPEKSGIIISGCPALQSAVSDAFNTLRNTRINVFLCLKSTVPYLSTILGKWKT